MLSTRSRRLLITDNQLSSTAARAKLAGANEGDRKIVRLIEPLQDTRWGTLVNKHPQASLFHSSAWLGALSRTYGYPVVAYTTSRIGQELEDAVVFCRVESWMTGRRLVSLPFSDHCEPLVDRHEDLAVLIAAIEEEVRRNWRYFEVRPLGALDINTSLHRTITHYGFHELDLQPSIETIFANLHKDSTQRKIRRAQREGLEYEEGATDELLDEFYRIFAVTRHRHYRPPQPKKWFENLIEGFGEALKIRVARKDGRGIATMMTIRHKGTLVYKYGGSDTRYHQLGGMHLLYWRCIEEAKASGLRSFDLGRTDAGQDGLITFKRRWGARESLLTYSRYANSQNSSHLFDQFPSRTSAAVKGIVRLMPTKLFSLAGGALYKHVG
jgi:CelD/BcsL family acetyltransferase involved in cellulose biosynthesis